MHRKSGNLSCQTMCIYIHIYVNIRIYKYRYVYIYTCANIQTGKHMKKIGKHIQGSSPPAVAWSWVAAESASNHDSDVLIFLHMFNSYKLWYEFRWNGSTQKLLSGILMLSSAVIWFISWLLCKNWLEIQDTKGCCNTSVLDIFGV